MLNGWEKTLCTVRVFVAKTGDKRKRGAHNMRAPPDYSSMDITYSNPTGSCRRTCHSRSNIQCMRSLPPLRSNLNLPKQVRFQSQEGQRVQQ